MNSARRGSSQSVSTSFHTRPQSKSRKSWYSIILVIIPIFKNVMNRKGRYREVAYTICVFPVTPIVIRVITHLNSSSALTTTI
ncbi:hypothetical protein BDZ94DRAFT_1259234, partial [Collybia nuda]